jgi:cholesterol transport system auxiliary component
MTLRKPIRAAAVSLCFAVVTGCSALSSIQSAATPLDTYELTPLPTSAARPRGQGNLEVALPTGTGALTSDRIVIKPTALQVQNLPDARWVNDATEHVQTLLVRSLAGTGRFALVTGEGAGPAPDFLLLTDLQAFQAEVGAGGDTTVVIRTTMTLLRDSDGRVLSTRSFATSAAAASTSADAVVAAFDEAMTQHLSEASDWLIRNTGT